MRQPDRQPGIPVKAGQETDGDGAGFWKGILRALAMRGRERPEARASTGKRLLAGSAMLATALAAAQSEPPAAPAHWIAYAQTVGKSLQTRLSEGTGELISRLHERLQTRQEGHATPLSIVTRVWISPEGQITQSAFDTLDDPQTDADLRAFLLSHPILAPPPIDMRQPLILQLTLRPNPEYR
ncbi:MAG: hypothetical protein LBF91_07705 [Azoarcus sp.]|jgi:hypothetical protein|nr:hypothetical protein [Azoarcus sp.]